jgi:DNA-binding transcriptional regulator LsrR (DeoR family)
MARTDELRLLTKVARMYHEQALGQRDIAKQLDLSQSTVSRLLKRAMVEEVVRVLVTPPPGTHTDLEQSLQERYALKEAVVVESGRDEGQILRDLGTAAAFYVETTLQKHEVIGISSWSETLLAMVKTMRPLPRSLDARVVQILGGVGNPAAEVHATHLTRRLADLVKGDAIFLPSPGVAGSKQSRDALLADPFVRQAFDLFPSVSLALVGIGTVEPSHLLASSGNVFSSEEIESLRSRGAVGDICLNFFDRIGASIASPLAARVISIPLPQLREVRRSVGIAGSQRKVDAIRAALDGRWINVLITDVNVARALLADQPNGTGRKRRS